MRRFIDLEDCQLPLLLLFLSFVMQAQYCLIHYSCQKKDFLNLFLTWGFPGLVLQGNGDLGFEEALLLLRDCSRTTIVAKLISHVKFCTIDFFTGFDPRYQAQIAPSLRKCYHGAKRAVFAP